MRSPLLAAAVLSLVSVAPLSGAAEVAPVLTAAGAPAADAIRPLGRKAPAGSSLMVIHYHRPDGNYRGWNLWAWADGADGRSVPFSGKTAFGRYAVVEFPSDAGRGNFIVRRGEWEEKEAGGDRSAPMGRRRVAEAWVIAGNPEVFTQPGAISFDPTLRAAFLDAPDRVRLTFSHAVDADAVTRDAVEVRIGDQAVPVAAVRAVEQGRTAHGFDVRLADPIDADDLRQPLTAALPGTEPVTIRPRNIHNDDAHTALDAQLGAVYTEQSTTFRTWSPVSSRVELLLLKTADAKTPATTLDLSPADGGLWEAQVAGDLHGTFYRYRFTHGGASHTVADIHGVAATADSRRSMVVNLDRTDPAGFRDHTPPTLKAVTDEIIYEVHVRDFSVADPSTPDGHRGRYPGLTHENPARGQRVSTGLSHLKDLGVTAVHLLPIQDYGGERHGYNWGYWTALFNVPESDYSTTPDDPAATIRELKQTIQTLHENGIRVILDVVYNHTATGDAAQAYEAPMPDAFFRTTDGGDQTNDAGTGNSVADERPMVRKYIVDSLKFWTDEYKIDGFRFDLVGTHHPETVRTIVKELRAQRPDITLYGEPWTGGGPTHFGKGAQRGTGFAVFNDHLRNALRGDLDGDATGFATGPGGDIPSVRNGLAGAIDDFADAPSESVNYVSAHDNRTFWDKLLHTHPGADDATLKRMHKLAHGLVLTAQGIPFVHGGADFARTKGGEHNSYNKGDAVNAFDWERKAEYRDVYDYMRGLIALRRAHPAFRLAEAAQVRKAIDFLDTPDPVVAFQLDPAAVRRPGRRLLVAANGGPDAATLNLPAGTWGVVVNDTRAGTEAFAQARGRIDLPPYSLWVGELK